MERTSFLRYRRGVAEVLTINPGHLLVAAPAIGIANVALERLVPRGLRAEVRLKDSWDVRIGDLLVQAEFGRVFVVLQIAREAANMRLFCAELWPPIGDEFDAGRLEAFWLESAAGSFDYENFSATIALRESAAGTAVHREAQSGAPFLYQLVDGDFDVYVELLVTVGTATQINAARLRADNADGDGAFASVGVADDGTTAQIVSVQSADGVTEFPIDGAEIGSQQSAFVRLRRIGARVTAYYAKTVLPPLREQDWIELLGNHVWLSTEQVRVGLTGDALPVGAEIPSDYFGQFIFFRNWQPASR